MSPGLATAWLPEAEYDDWTKLVRSSPGGAIYHTPSYLDALASVTGGRFRIAVVRKGDEMVGGIALYEEDHPPGVVVSPRLLLYYNGPLLRERGTRYPSREAAEHRKICDEVARWIEDRSYARTTLKPLPQLHDIRPFLARGWSARPTYSYVVPLEDLDEAWNRIENNQRRLIRRAEDEGITTSEDDDFESFYRLHGATMERKDRATYLEEGAFRTFFERLHSQELATLFHARLPDGTAVATALVLLGDHPIAHTVSAAADARHQALGTNPLLRWTSFRSLAARGYEGVDLTDASLNPVTRFKSKLGASLTLSLELDGPRSLRYRTWDRARRGSRLARSVAKKLLRRS